MKKYLDEIENVLQAFPKRTSKQNPEAYIGGGQSKLRYIGLKVPHLHQALETGFSFSTKNESDQAEIWHFVWKHSDCYEVMSLSLSWFYQPKRRHLLLKEWRRLKTWSTRIDNWAHSDTLSGIYSRILEDSSEAVYPTLVKWNSSRNPWLRRLSIVSLIYYASHRNQILPLNKIIPLLDSQLDFDHYYVQKGIGWTLREAGHVYPQEIYSFIHKNIGRLNSHAFSSAIEKIDLKHKIKLKELRRQKRTIK